jgi:hypothetical protein
MSSANGTAQQPAERPEYTNADLALLARWFLADGGTLEEFVDVLEKPHRWMAEMNAAQVLRGLGVGLYGKDYRPEWRP